MQFYNRNTFVVLILLMVVVVKPAFTQDHHHHMHQQPVDSVFTSVSKADDHASSTHPSTEHTHDAGSMPSVMLQSLAMSIDGSGTSWHPVSSPLEGLHGNARSWHLMLHGRSFLRYTNQDIFEAGYRGAQTFGAPTWIMGMMIKPLSERGQLAVRAMFTGEPFTEGGDGYPLLFQTGESYNGIPLVDWQHPHDLIAELSVTYSHTLGDRAGFFVYAALPGEPAIGSPAFMHRPSARHIPNSPIGHHWQDATHVTFGVSTLGFIYGPVKLDASIFTGREPDEERLGFDKPRFDSYSARLSINLGEYWAFQASRAYLTGPEVQVPDLDMWRTVASILYGRTGNKATLASSIVWGVNDPAGNFDPAKHIHIIGRNGTHLHAHTAIQHSLLAETDVELRQMSYYSRLEFLQKDGAELGIPSLQDQLFWIGSLTLGASRRVLNQKLFDVSGGLQTTLYRVPEGLRYVYGHRPVSGQIYLRMNLK